MNIPRKVWKKYSQTLRDIDEMTSRRAYMKYMELDRAVQDGTVAKNVAIEEFESYVYGIVTKYGEASSAAACEMYDAIASIQKANVPEATPAATATMRETRRAVQSAMSVSTNPEMIGSVAGRLVKQAGADTMLQNAQRDGAQWAWIPSGGETCAFCITLASQGWLPASKAQMDGNHAEHIHPNCGCAFAIRFGDDLNVAGYNPDIYKRLYDEAPGATSKDKINAMRRKFYAENKKLVGTKSSVAEEFIPLKPGKAILDFEEKSRNLKNERAIVTYPDGRVYSQSQGKGNRVSVQEPSEAGFIFSHNHPIDETFSVADVKGFERAGYKQLRAASPEKTYVLEALNPKRIPGEDRNFTGAMGEHWRKLDEESTKRRRSWNRANAQEEAQKLLEWRRKEESKWLKENAPKYGYRYFEEAVK